MCWAMHIVIQLGDGKVTTVVHGNPTVGAGVSVTNLVKLPLHGFSKYNYLSQKILL